MSIRLVFEGQFQDEHMIINSETEVYTQKTMIALLIQTHTDTCTLTQSFPQRYACQLPCSATPARREKDTKVQDTQCFQHR